MADEITIEGIADTMFKLVSRDAGQKKYKPGDLTKQMIEYYGADKVDKKTCKKAIRILVDGGTLVYTYFGGTFLEIPHQEAAAMKDE
jgi:hypothetical protein